MPVTGHFVADFTKFHTAVEQAEVKLKSFDSNSNKVESSLSRMTNAFSGTRVIQDATLMAAAIEKVGGVSRLTDAELRKVGATATEAAAKLRAMGEGVPGTIQHIVDAAAKLDPALANAGKAANLLQSAFGQFTAAGLATQAINRLTSELLKFIEVGTKMPAMETSFLRLSAAMGQSSSVMLTAMHQASKGLVTDFDLMQSANKAMLLGLPITEESLISMTESAVALGRAMGQDATQSLNDMIAALGRSSPQLLDNLGLIVDVADANQKYADELHKSAETLTENEKKLAFYNATMDAARAKTAQLGEQTLQLSELMTKAWVSISNTIITAIGGIDRTLGRVLTNMTEAARFFADWIRFGPGMAVALSEARAAANETGPAVQRVGDAVRNAGSAAAGAAPEMRGYADALGETSRQAKAVADIEGSLAAARKTQREERKKQADEDKRAAEEETKAADRRRKAEEDAIAAERKRLFGEEDIAKAERYVKAVGDVTNVTKMTTTAQDELATQMHKAIEALVLTGRSSDVLMDKFIALMIAAEAASRRAKEGFEQLKEEAAATSAWVKKLADDTAAAVANIPKGGNIWATGMEIPPGGNIWTSGMPVRSPNLWVSEPGAMAAAAGAAGRSPVAVTVNAQNSFYSTPESINQLADVVGRALLSRLPSR
jgi:hypothetical protein